MNTWTDFALSDHWQVSILAKTSLLAMFGLIGAYLLTIRWFGSQRPSLGHIVLTATFIGLFAVPIATSLPPLWQVEVAALPKEPLPLTDALIPGADDLNFDQQEGSKELSNTRQAFAPVIDSPDGYVNSDELLVIESSAFEADLQKQENLAVNVEASEKATALPWPVIALCVYLAGVIFFAGRLMFGWLWLRKMTREGTELEWNKLGFDFGEINKERDFAERNTTFLIANDQVSVPMVWGLHRPTILVPNHFKSWDKDRQRVVLSHELAHVARRDAWWDLIASVVGITYWFHPLIWFVIAQHRSYRERAADALVLQSGVNAFDYSRQILSSVVSGSHSPGLAAPFVRGESIRRRIQSLLSLPQTASRRVRVVVSCCVLTFAMGVCSVGVVKVLVAAEDEQQKEIVLPELVDLAYERSPNFVIPGTTPPPEQINELLPTGWRIEAMRTLNHQLPDRFNGHGRVTDIDGNPISDAVVILRWRESTMFHSTEGRRDDVLAAVRTDELGEFQFDNVPVSWGQAGHAFKMSLVALAKGHGVSWLDLPTVFEEKTDGYALQLSASATASARIVDHAGLPVVDAVANVKVINSLNRQLVLIAGGLSMSAKTNGDGALTLVGLDKLTETNQIGSASKIQTRRITSAPGSGEAIIDGIEIVIQGDLVAKQKNVFMRGTHREIVLAKNYHLHGQIIDANNEPVQGFLKVQQARTDGLTLLLDQEGGFDTYIDLASEPKNLLLSYQGWESWRYKTTGAENPFSGRKLVEITDQPERIEWKLNPARFVTGIVVDHDKQPMRFVNVEWHGKDEQSNESNVVLSANNSSMSPGPNVLRSTAELNGMFRIGIPTKKGTIRLTAGSSDAIIDQVQMGDGIEENIEPNTLFTIPAGQEDLGLVRFTVPKNEPLIVQAVDSQGIPIDGATVRFSNQSLAIDSFRPLLTNPEGFVQLPIEGMGAILSGFHVVISTIDGQQASKQLTHENYLDQRLIVIQLSKVEQTSETPIPGPERLEQISNQLRNIRLDGRLGATNDDRTYHTQVEGKIDLVDGGSLNDLKGSIVFLEDQKGLGPYEPGIREQYSIDIDSDGTFRWSSSDLEMPETPLEDEGIWGPFYLSIGRSPQRGIFGPFLPTGGAMNLGTLEVRYDFKTSIRFIDENDQPVQGVRVTGLRYAWGNALGIYGPGIRDLRSDSNGVLALENQISISRTFTIEAPGYLNDTRQLELKPGQVFPWRLVKEREPIFNGPRQSKNNGLQNQETLSKRKNRNRQFEQMRRAERLSADKPSHVRSVRIRLVPTDQAEFAGTLLVASLKIYGGSMPNARRFQNDLWDSETGDYILDVPVGDCVSIDAKGLIGGAIDWPMNRFVSAQIPAGEEQAIIEVPIKPAGIATGQFLDEQNRPVSKFMVQVGTQYIQVDDPLGRFAIGPLLLQSGISRRALFLIEGTGRVVQSEFFPMNQAKPIANLLVRMPEPKRITGRVLDEAGNPMRNETVVFSPQFSLIRSINAQVYRQGDFEMQTDSEGKFYFEYTENQPPYWLGIEINHIQIAIVNPKENGFDPNLGDLTVETKREGAEMGGAHLSL